MIQILKHKILHLIKKLTVIRYVCAFLFIQNVMSQNVHLNLNDENLYIVYKDSIKLKWSDFKAKPRKDSAGIASNFHIECNNVIQKKEYIVIVSTYMAKDKSYPLETLTIDSLYCLNHELTHFKISEVCARYCRRDINSIKSKRAKAIYKQILKIFSKYYEMQNNLQKLYDEETKHCVNRGKQREWNDLVDKWLNDLSEFSSTKVILHLK